MLAACSGPPSAPEAEAPDPLADAGIFSRDNLVAWCIVPFDASKRGPKERAEMLERLLDMAAEQFWSIGTVLEPRGFGIVTNRLRNTPEALPLSWIYPTPNPCNTCQFYVEE